MASTTTTLSQSSFQPVISNCSQRLTLIHFASTLFYFFFFFFVYYFHYFHYFHYFSFSSSSTSAVLAFTVPR